MERQRRFPFALEAEESRRRKLVLPEAAEIAAETVRLGDPAYAGALAGVQLGLDVYHILDDEVKADVPPEVWDEQIGVMADILEADELNKAVAGIRAQPLD